MSASTKKKPIEFKRKPQHYDKGCKHGKRYRFRFHQDSACALCVRDRANKNRDEYLNHLRDYQALHTWAANELAPGTKVMYWFVSCGYDHDQRQIKQLGMKLGQVFTIDHTDEGDCHTSFYLREFPGKSFNSFNFAPAPSIYSVLLNLLEVCPLIDDETGHWTNLIEGELNKMTYVNVCPGGMQP